MTLASAWTGVGLVILSASARASANLVAAARASLAARVMGSASTLAASASATLAASASALSLFILSARRVCLAKKFVAFIFCC